MIRIKTESVSRFLLFLGVLSGSIFAFPCAADTVVLHGPREAAGAANYPILFCEISPGARYRIANGSLLPVLGSFAFSPLGEPALRTEITATAESLPGGLSRVIVRSSDNLDTLSVRLIDPKGGTISRAIGFPAERGESGETWVALLGVPSDTRGGEYRLDIQIASGSRSIEDLEALTVRERVFSSEQIPLTKEMAALRNLLDPRKTAEAKELAETLSTPHPDALYEKGTFENPLPAARRSAGYGDRRRYLVPDSPAELSLHGGIDLASPEGTVVAACGTGKVVLAGERLLTGWTVAIEHLPGLFSLYFHMSGISVTKGNIVEKGQPIGTVGRTGFATGPHLHWEVCVSRTLVDPDPLTFDAPFPKTLEPTVLDKRPGMGTFEAANSTEGR
jgi:murein DD-endopeptidase MepM/ murein hydrolase activator NlpD